MLIPPHKLIVQRWIAAAATLSMMLASSMASGGQDYEIKSVKLGADIAGYMDSPDWKCTDSNDSLLGDVICKTASLNAPLETVAGEHTKWPFVYFRGGKLEWIFIPLHEPIFNKVTDAFKLKYGKPKRTETSMIQNGFGASFKNITYTWSNRTSAIQATRYSGDLENSLITFSSDKALYEFAKRTIKDTASRAKDL